MLSRMLMSRAWVLAIVVVGCISMIGGCGSGDGVQSAEADISVEEQAAVDSQAALKQLLESVSASGEGGSAIAGVGSSIENLTIDDAKKQSLLKAYDELNSTTDPARVKAVASQMASQL